MTDEQRRHEQGHPEQGRPEQRRPIDDLYRYLIKWQMRFRLRLGEDVDLWCDGNAGASGHPWSRPFSPAWDTGRLSIDETCPEHDGLPLNRGPHPELTTWPSGYGECGQ